MRGSYDKSWQVPRGRLGRLVGLLLALWAMSLAAWAAQQTPPPAQTPPFRGDVLLVAPPDAPLRAAVWTDRGRYRPGAELTIGLFVDSPAYVLLFAVEPSGAVRLLLPNGFDLRSFMRPGTHWLPAPGYRLRLTGPPGSYYIQLVATMQVLSVPWAQALRTAPFPTLDTDAHRFKEQLEAALRASGAGWTAAWAAFTVGSGGP